MAGRMPCMGDIEASGLGLDSYPIEIAWSLPTGEVRSVLIQTDASWGDAWDPVAEELHHISRAMLAQEGLPAARVAEAMNRDLEGQDLYCDGGDYDLVWLNQLFEAAGARPTFRFRHFDQLLALAGVVDSSRREAAEALARRDIGELTLHRAANDVKLLQRWYIRARGGLRGAHPKL